VRVSRNLYVGTGLDPGPKRSSVYVLVSPRWDSSADALTRIPRNTTTTKRHFALKRQDESSFTVVKKVHTLLSVPLSFRFPLFLPNLLLSRE